MSTHPDDVKLPYNEKLHDLYWWSPLSVDDICRDWGVTRQQLLGAIQPLLFGATCEACECQIAAHTRSDFFDLARELYAGSVICVACAKSDPERAARHDRQVMPYAEYLQTEEWATKRAQAVERAGWRCQVCNAGGRLHVHHRTYERRGNEEPGDLTALCEQCHDLFHRHSRLTAPDSHTASTGTAA